MMATEIVAMAHLKPNFEAGDLRKSPAVRMASPKRSKLCEKNQHKLFMPPETSLRSLEPNVAVSSSF